MPLLELRILEIHSFPNFSLTRFDILSWNFADYFVLLYYRTSSSVINFRQFFLGVMPLLECRILKIHSFPHFSLTRFDILSWNFIFDFVLLYYRSSSSVINFRQFFLGLMPLLECRILKIQFSTLFSYMLWHIELKFCIWLCFTVLQIKIECRQFPSIFVGVMPLLEIRILEIHSFPHFSLTCFDISSWNFAHDFVLTVLQTKFQCCQCLSFFVGVMPLLELRILKINSFPHFSLTRFDILSWNFAYDFV